MASQTTHMAAPIMQLMLRLTSLLADSPLPAAYHFLLRRRGGEGVGVDGVVLPETLRSGNAFSSGAAGAGFGIRIAV